MKQGFSTSEEVPINHIDAASAGDESRAPPFSDEALALRFAEVHGNDLRYVADWNRWLRWDGTRWQFDRTLFAFALREKYVGELLLNATPTKPKTCLQALRRSTPSLRLREPTSASPPRRISGMRIPGCSTHRLASWTCARVNYRRIGPNTT